MRVEKTGRSNDTSLLLSVFCIITGSCRTCLKKRKLKCKRHMVEGGRGFVHDAVCLQLMLRTLRDAGFFLSEYIRGVDSERTIMMQRWYDRERSTYREVYGWQNDRKR